MRRKLSRSKKVAGLFVAVLVAFILALLYGPLFPWSPVKPGYALIRYPRADVYYDPAQPLNDDYRAVGAMMDEAEQFHRLKFRRSVKVIACRNWRSCDWFLPWLHIRGLGGVTLATGDVIYLTPRIKEKNYSIAEYLRHELTHALIFQNTTIRDAFKLNDVAWFNEGLAVSFGRQTAYLSQAEFTAKAASVELANCIDPARIAKQQAAGAWDARLAYPAQRYFVEYLKAKFGQDVFQSFLLRCIHNPANHSSLFQENFHTPLLLAVEDYQKAVRAGLWPPQNQSR